MTKRRVFISYAHANSEHKRWVSSLAVALRAHSLDVKLDQDDLRLGQLIDKFQRDGISLADRVVVVCSDAYVAKCDTDRNSGAGQEKALMTAEMKRDSGTIKFIPLKRDNSSGVLPSCLGGRLWLDANGDFDDVVRALVEEIEKDV
jgi:hypothetical protein